MTGEDHRLGQPSRPDESEEPLVATSRWKIDRSQSEVRFSIRHLMIATVTGHFERFGGFIAFDETHRSPLVVVVEIEANSITTGIEQRDIHLRSGDFFDVETYPIIRFVSREIESTNASHYRVGGDLQLHGVTREIELDATVEGIGQDPWGNTRASFSGTTRINRLDFGLNWNTPLNAGGVMVGDTVRITLDIQAIKQA